ncbi:unnamed protein product [Linum trigynum]|uniref:Uncharacterized protein n=1 Tax=Linum trigynum TaxID=586398 RepID=A0AAV2FWE8_9ROSI
MIKSEGKKTNGAKKPGSDIGQSKESLAGHQPKMKTPGTSSISENLGTNPATTPVKGVSKGRKIMFSPDQGKEPIVPENAQPPPPPAEPMECSTGEGVVAMATKIC